MDDGQHLIVMDLIVPLNQAQALGKECNWVPHSILQRLLGDGHSSCHILCISFYMVHLGVVQKGQHWSSGDELLQLAKGFLFL